jgi:hypothetical protein
MSFLKYQGVDLTRMRFWSKTIMHRKTRRQSPYHTAGTLIANGKMEIVVNGTDPIHLTTVLNIDGDTTACVCGHIIGKVTMRGKATWSIHFFQSDPSPLP